MLTIEQCRKTLGEDWVNLSDKQVEELRDFLYKVCYIVVNKYKENGPEIFTQKPKEEIRINKEWHNFNKLRSFASLDEKVKRHIDHIANCKCWHLPRYVRKEIEKRLS